jgi:hypothetical protein
MSGEGQKVIDCIRVSPKSLRRFWSPLSIAALNTAPHEASARDLRRVMLGTLAKGEAGLRIRFPRTSVRDSFVDPALSELRKRGVEFRLGSELRRLHLAEGRVDELDFGEERVVVGRDDSVILAVSADRLAKLLAGIDAPQDFSPIVTVHFRVDAAAEEPARIACLLDSRPLWVQIRDGVASVTVGAAHDLSGADMDMIAGDVWMALSRFLGLKVDGLPPYRVVKEPRGVFAHTPANRARRPLVSTRWQNVFVAGDWVRTGLSATIESAIVAGNAAADGALRAAKS